jgi:Zn-dependent protease
MNLKVIIKILVLASTFVTASILDTTAIYYIAMLLIHELTHCLTGILIGYSVNKLNIMPFGLSASFNEEFIKPLDDILISVSGPLINFVFFVLFFSLSKFSDSFIILSRANLILCVFNMLPAGFLDGGRILRNVLKTYLSFHSAYLITNINGIILGCSIIIAAFGSVIGVKAVVMAILGVYFIYNGIIGQKDIVINIIKDALYKQTYIYSRRRIIISAEFYSGDCKLFDVIKYISFHKYMVIFINEDGKLGKRYE